MSKKLLSQIDLHTHTTHSDGSMPPAALMRLADELGLYAIAITDHDTVGGLQSLSEGRDAFACKLVSGIEISASYTIDDYEPQELHILGFGVDPYSEELEKGLETFREIRNTRNTEMIAALERNGVHIDYEELKALCVSLEHEEDTATAVSHEPVIGRAHFARYLSDHAYVSSPMDAFTRYLSPGCCAYVPKKLADAKKAIGLIHKAGGLAFWAHPVNHLSSRSRIYSIKGIVSYENIETVALSLIEMGLDGIEALYSTYSPEDSYAMKQIARKHGLLISGGSDFHGELKPKISLGIGTGDLYVGMRYYEDLMEAIASRRG